jgi:hypothetical protein
MDLSQLSDHLKSLIDPKDRARLGLDTETAAPDPVTLGLSGNEHQNSRLILEPAEHDLVMKWAKYQGLLVLHAGTHKAVNDLPPGWPDFSLVYGAAVCLVEMKTKTRWRADQVALRAKLEAQSTPVFVTRDATGTIEVFKAWLAAHFGWKPK